VTSCSTRFDCESLNQALIAIDRARRSSAAPSALDLLRSAPHHLGVAHAGRDVRELCEAVDVALNRPSRRLAVYGSLGPGRPNHHVVAGIRGRWSRGTVAGTLHDSGWGATMGYPGMIWRPGGDPIIVNLLESDELHEHWARLDAFEGGAYVRVLVPVETGAGMCVVANLYEIREHPASNPPARRG